MRAAQAAAPRPIVTPAPPAEAPAATAAAPAGATRRMMHPKPPAAAPQVVATPQTVEDARRLLGFDRPAPAPAAPAPPRPLDPRELHTIADVVQHRVLRHLERERNRTRTRL
ncbi:MAG: hypothetical protein R3F65_17465 [bacterium]